MVSMGLDPNQHQGAFGESFVRVLTPGSVSGNQQVPRPLAGCGLSI